jgi:hypothetical protein
MHDVIESYKILDSLPSNSTVIGDKGYVHSKIEEFLSNLGMHLAPIYKQNIKNYKRY